MFIPDPGYDFYQPWTRIQSQKDTGSRIRIKEFKYFNPKNCFYVLGNMIRDVHPGSGPDLTHPGSGGQKDTGSRIRIRNLDSIFWVDVE